MRIKKKAGNCTTLMEINYYKKFILRPSDPASGSVSSDCTYTSTERFMYNVLHGCTF